MGTQPFPAMIGPYTVVERLGAGGMATVYRARHPDGHEVALKVLALHLADHAPIRRRFEQEARTLLQFRHPHILPVYDFGEDGADLYMTMRLMPGHSLADIFHGQPLPVAQVAEITRQVAGALDYAHARGVIHRDIKPTNILLDGSGTPYLADFGVAFIASDESDARLTRVGAFVGTVAYASPEQVQGERLDRPSDIYSLAVMVFQMCTGHLPFRGGNALAIMKQHMHEPPPNPLAYNPMLPMSLYHVLARALAKLPEHRYPSAMKFSEAVDAALGQHPRPEVTNDDDDSWLYDDIRPIATTTPATTSAAIPAAPENRVTPPIPPPPPPPPDPAATVVAGPGPSADTGEVGDFAYPDVSGVDFADVDEIAARFETAGFDALDFDTPGFDTDEFEALFGEPDTSSSPPPSKTGESPESVASEPEPDSGPESGMFTRPVIRPITPPPDKSRESRSAWYALPGRVYSLIAVGGLVATMVVTLLVLVLVRRMNDESGAVDLPFDGTFRGAAVGVLIDYPAGWYVIEAGAHLLPGDPSPAILLADVPVPQDGPYTDAAVVIAVQRIDPVDVFRVSLICQTRIPYGPADAFVCMDQQGYITPVHEPFKSGQIPGGVWLPGTLPPGPASIPMVVFPAAGERWLVVILAQWDKARWTGTGWGGESGYDVLARVAESVRVEW